MLSKEKFVGALEFIKQQNEKQNNFCCALETLSPGSYVDCFLYSEYETAYVEMIKAALDLSEENDIIEWWLYDCDYGKSAELKVNETEIKLNSAESLYDYIVSEVLNGNK